LVFSTSLLTAVDAQSRFTRFELPLNVSVEIPENWWLLTGDINTTIQAAGEAATKLANIPIPKGNTVNLLRANSMPRTTYASIAINVNDSDIAPSEVRALSKSDFKEFERYMAETMKKVLPMQNLEFLESMGLESRIISGHVALVFNYRRSGPQGPVIVSTTRLFFGDKELSFNLAHRESEAPLWGVIVEYIKQSIKVSGNNMFQTKTGETDFTVYRDAKYAFSFHYPRSWAPVESTLKITRFKAVSEAGNGAEDVSINAVEDVNAKGLTPWEHIAFISKNPRLLLSEMRKSIPSAQLVSHGRAKLSNQDAFYIIVDFNYEAAGYLLEYRMIQYQTGRDGVFYTITMRAPRSEWKENVVIFKNLAARFILHPAGLKHKADKQD